MKDNRITLRAILFGIVASALFSWYTVMAENFSTSQRILTATQIPVLPYLLLIVCVLALNPLLRRLRVIRALMPVELMIIFVMTTVSAGVSTFGLASQLVPVVSGLFNRDWNTAQARWDRYIQPFVNEAYFISEPGLRRTAAEALAAENAWRDADTVLRAARLAHRSRVTVQEVEDELEALRADSDGISAEAARQRLIRTLAMERDRLATAETAWEPHGQQWRMEDVLDTYPAYVEDLRAAHQAQRAALADLEAKAFDKVEPFRVGLPETMRAVPGILPMGEERMSVYLARLRRMGAGLRAMGELRTAGKALRRGGDRPESLETAATGVDRAAAHLEPVADPGELREVRSALQASQDAIETTIGEIRLETERMRNERRHAEADDFPAIDRRIATLQSELNSSLDALKKAAEDIRDDLGPRLRLAEEMEAVRAVLLDTQARLRAGDGLSAGEGRAAVRAAQARIEALNISWRSLVAGDVPWGLWIGPLARWSLLVFLAYVILMTFNVLIFRQWAHHEKLVYPLAELPLQLGGFDEEGGSAADAVPALYRSPLFWVGAFISASVLGWNILATRQIITGVNPIPMRFDWGPYITDSLFSGLMPRAHHQVFFTLVGISFLVPARISKSLWGFHIAYMLMLLGLVWLGYGVNERSFPASMRMELNFRTAIGGGALVAFSSMTLWKCRRYLLCGALPHGLEGLAPDERRELRISSLLFMISSVLMIGVLTFGMGANLLFAVFCYLVIMIVTIGMVRVVAEGGLLVFQCWFNPFHVIRSAFGMHRTWSASSLLAPLVVFYYVLFWDLKTFIAPAMANALKIRDSLGMKRLGFHVAVWLGIAAAVVTALATHIIFGYQHGANTMHAWFYENGPRDFLFAWIKDMGMATSFDPSGLYGMLVGLAVMTVLMVFRRRRFWLPHPIGLVMWVNPIMWAFWFSILLGWAFKVLVSRYGDRSTYLRFREFFIGLIVGELIMCLFGVDLNRN